MPIRASERAKYPPDWPLVSERIRTRAGWRCERCGVPQYAVGHRDEAGAFVRAAGNGPLDFAGMGKRWPDGERLRYAEALEVARALNDHAGDADADGRHWFVVVLTVAHLNHDPADCRAENLEALCQRCHLQYDRQHHSRTRGETRLRRQATLPGVADPAPPSVGGGTD